ncbi:hypothetical protein Mapa_012253 [Marchantia paleacea]|nr:hypothetical protein Mapa_012253 [Marchantia paleacea]
MNPATFLRVLGPEPWNVAYAEPSIRPDDSRYGENPNRVQRHTQFQVILKPDPGNSQELYLGSLAALGIDIKAHDVRFVEDNWESPVLGAWGLGWEKISCNAAEELLGPLDPEAGLSRDLRNLLIFTVVVQAGSLPLTPVSVEITYGLERILMSLQGVDHFKKIQYAPGITYGELFLENEKEMSAYNMDLANVERIQKRFELYAEEAQDLLAQGLAIPAYVFSSLVSNFTSMQHLFRLFLLREMLDLKKATFLVIFILIFAQIAEVGLFTLARYDNVLKTSHAFNLLDARGAVGVTERARFFGRMRTLARQCAQLWMETRERLNYPMGVWEESPALSLPSLDQKASQIDTPQTFVLEIGSEELPPQDVVSAVSQVIAEDLAPRQDDEEKEMRGPPATKAFDKDGKPTKAAEGFCKRNNVTVEDLVVKMDGKTEYVYAVVKEQSRPTLEVLAGDLPEIISNLSFPKTMRWNSQV